MAGARTPETVAQEIEREREQLGLAVSNLRSELRAATDVRAQLRSRWPHLSAVATIAVGAIAFRAVLRRRGRHEPTLVRVGRFAIVERD
jgi:hypothetical protein